MSTYNKVSKRYAQALFSAVQEGNADTIATAETLHGQLESLACAWKSEPMLVQALLNPAVSRQEKEAVLIDLARASGASEEMLFNFLKILNENGRVAALAEVADEFQVCLIQYKKSRMLEVSSAFELSDAEKSELTSELVKTLGEEVQISWSVDASLIGGLRIRSGDMIFDTSIKASLDKARSALVA